MNNYKHKSLESKQKLHLDTKYKVCVIDLVYVFNDNIIQFN